MSLVKRLQLLRVLINLEYILQAYVRNQNIIDRLKPHA